MEKNINTFTENKPSEKPETYYNSWKWQDWIAEAIMELDRALEKHEISHEDRQKRRDDYRKAMESVN